MQQPPGHNPFVSREPTQAPLVGKTMDLSLQIIMDWQGAELPSRFAFGSRALRKLMIRVRMQPVNFLIVVHQSVEATKNGQSQCRVGMGAVRILLNDPSEPHSGAHKKQFTITILKELKESAATLNQDTNNTLKNLRLLRTTLIEIFSEASKLANKGVRSAFFAPLSRHLMRGVKTSENSLRELLIGLEEVEKSLNLVIQWWQTIEAEVDYLLTLEDSSLVNEKNTVILEEIMHVYKILENHLHEYRDTVRRLYDVHATKLDETNKKHLNVVKDRTNLTMSEQGRLESEE